MVLPFLCLPGPGKGLPFLVCQDLCYTPVLIKNGCVPFLCLPGKGLAFLVCQDLCYTVPKKTWCVPFLCLPGPGKGLPFLVCQDLCYTPVLIKNGATFPMFARARKIELDPFWGVKRPALFSGVNSQFQGGYIP